MYDHSPNMPILYRNILDGIASDVGQRAFLWAAERAGEDRMLYRAEKFAHEVERLNEVIWRLIGMGRRVSGFPGDLAKKIDLWTFTMRRHAHLRFPAQKGAWI